MRGSVDFSAWRRPNKTTDLILIVGFVLKKLRYAVCQILLCCQTSLNCNDEMYLVLFKKFSLLPTITGS